MWFSQKCTERHEIKKKSNNYICYQQVAFQFFQLRNTVRSTNRITQVQFLKCHLRKLQSDVAKYSEEHGKRFML